MSGRIVRGSRFFTLDQATNDADLGMYLANALDNMEKQMDGHLDPSKVQVHIICHQEVE